MEDEDLPIWELEYRLDQAERLVHDLHNELAEYEEGSYEFNSICHELSDAENEVEYWNNLLNR